jgi:hypothetical protein
MRPNGTLRPTGISAAQRLQLDTRERVLERIKNINWELEAIHSEMGLAGPQAAVAREFFGDDDSSVQVLAHFKAALDRLRRTVWSCLENPDELVKAEREQAVRLQRATEMMRKLSPQPGAPMVHQSGSFFERLNGVIDTYMETRPLRLPPDSTSHGAGAKQSKP